MHIFSHFSKPQLLKRASFSHFIYLSPYFWIFNYFPLIYVSCVYVSVCVCICLCVLVQYCFDYHIFVAGWNQGTWPPSLFLFSRLFYDYIKFRIIYSRSFKNVAGILIGTGLRLQIALGGMDSLRILILPIHELGISFHLFVSSNFSYQYHSFQRTSLPLLITFISIYFILFDVTITELLFFFLIVCH